MKTDFSTPMTFYELIAIILAAVAISIPIVQAIWKKWIVSAKLSFLPTGRAILFFNQSGSYIRIDGVYEAEQKSISIKKAKIKVTRQKDERKLNLTWSSLISPVNQNLVGNYLQTTESAHPFRIEADSIVCAFTEFGDEFNSFEKTFEAATEPLFKRVADVRKSYATYPKAESFFKATDEYASAKDILEKEFFWEIGKYNIDIEVNYNKDVKHFYYVISVESQEHKLLINNIDEALITPLKAAYGINRNYRYAIVELKEK